MTPQLAHFLVIGAALFAFGIFTAVTRKNAVGVLMGVELILNGANVNLVAFHHWNPDPAGHLTGQIYALFVIVLAAAEAAIALAIVLAVNAAQKSIDVTEANTLRQ